MKSTPFPGLHNLKQMDKIIEVLGFPEEEELSFINCEHSLNYINKLPRPKGKINWAEKIPDANPQALDLL